MLCLCCAPLAALARPLLGWGYVAWWMQDQWRSMPLAQLDRLLFFELRADESGRIVERNGWPENWSALQQTAQKYNTPLDLTLTLTQPAAFNALFSSAQATQKLLDEALALARGPGVGGLHIDIEIYSDAHAQSVDGFRRFLLRLAERLREQSPASVLSAFIPLGASAPLYDELTVSVLDYAIMQGYDAHWPAAERAGPIAPLLGDEAVTWQKAVALGVKLGMRRDRILVSFPLYGYEWPVEGPKPRAGTRGKAEVTSFAPLSPAVAPNIQINIEERVRRYGAWHDPSSGSAYYQFSNKEGHFVEGWFEDWHTLSRKIDYLTAEDIGGIAFFPLGYDNSRLVEFFLRQRGARASGKAAVEY